MKHHIFKHFHTVNKHRFKVFINACHLGIPFRGLVHDLSKYNPKEFLPSSKYYKGTGSPLYNQRLNEDWYSSILIHHTNRNKHHYEYWVDIFKGDLVLTPIPYKYSLEYVADVISASQTYNGKNFKINMPIEYFSSKEEYYLMHKATIKFVHLLLEEYSKNKFKNLKKKYTKKLYEETKRQFPHNEIVYVNRNNTNLNKENN